MKEIEKPAFGFSESEVHGESCVGARGLTKREYLVIAVIQGLASNPGTELLSEDELGALGAKYFNAAINLAERR